MLQTTSNANDRICLLGIFWGFSNYKSKQASGMLSKDRNSDVFFDGQGDFVFDHMPENIFQRLQSGEYPQRDRA